MILCELPGVTRGPNGDRTASPSFSAMEIGVKGIYASDLDAGYLESVGKKNLGELS